MLCKPLHLTTGLQRLHPEVIYCWHLSFFFQIADNLGYTGIVLFKIMYAIFQQYGSSLLYIIILLLLIGCWCYFCTMLYAVILLLSLKIFQIDFGNVKTEQTGLCIIW